MSYGQVNEPIPKPFGHRKGKILNPHSEVPIPDQVSRVKQHYVDLTEPFYAIWSDDHVHFGLFEPGECIRPGELPCRSASHTRALERMIAVGVAPAGLKPEHRVVDAGCGVGGTAISVVRTYQCKVTGVNLSEVQLEKATRKATEAGLNHLLDFKQADCSKALPFADSSIDAVINIESACHYADRRQFLHEVFRILKPGGRLAATDWMARDGLTAEQYDDHIAPVCKSWALFSLESPATYAEKLPQAGFHILEFEGFGGKDKDNVTIMQMLLSKFLPMYRAGLPIPQFLNAVERISTLGAAWRDGYFQLQRYCAEKPHPTRR